jgi:uncharacterized membrane protein
MQNPQGYGYPPNNAPSGKSSTGLDANLASLIAYFFWFLGGLIFFLIEKENRFVRFHAMQSILYNAAVVAIFIVITIISIILSQISWILASMIGLLTFVLWIGSIIGWILLMVKAYQNKMFKLPVIGNMAESIVSK